MWPANYPVDVARSIVERRRLRFNSPLLDDLQAEIIRSYRRLCRSKGTKQIDLLGYKIFFMSEGPLRYLFHEIFMRASYFFKASSDCPVIFDCGSNIGMSILFFKKLYPNARIVAFEPDPSTFETLRHNVDENHLSNVDLHQIALSDRSGTIELFRDVSPQSSSLVMSTLRQRHNGPGVTVPARRLSDFISSEIDLLKLDIEGAEDAVMGDLASTGKLRQIKRLHLEYHHHIDASADKLSSMLQLIETNGFGYQLRTPTQRWPSEASFQDISIYCYRK
jgi:FkbM family methyltransferase